MKMQKKTVLLPPDLRAALERIAFEQNKSLSAVAREAITQYVRPNALSSSVVMGADGSFDASKDEEFLAEHWAHHVEAPQKRPDWPSSSSEILGNE